MESTVKEKRWVLFKGEQDPTSIPVEWICWLNGQRKRAPTPEEMAELEAKRERVKQNVALLKKEEEEKRLANAAHLPSRTIGKGTSPDLESFIKQFPGASDIQRRGSEKVSVTADDELSEERFSEPTGSGLSFKPGTWQPPT
ncbi:mimitin, mitochondrial isoform X2 [Phalaenopsis equestris]|uniref:mimitin, mitochondrial isoform X2 n=1 Tax=Phalaenopsis equestris TaxID=78828 RepID=UPI0009E26533|nr:mimitin, mitochondrial isoform X2 [Phalaenopsis equestris]